MRTQQNSRLGGLLFLAMAGVTIVFASKGLLNPFMEGRLPSIFYFTVQTNFIAAAWLIVKGLAIMGNNKAQAIAGHFLLMLATTVYITITGIVYAGVLVPIYADKEWVYSIRNIWLHYVIPVFCIIVYLRTCPNQPMRYRWILHLIWYPLFYLGIVLLVYLRYDAFIYPFLNPSFTGSLWGQSLVYTGLVLLLMGLGIFYTWMNRRIHVHRKITSMNTGSVVEITKLESNDA